MAITSRQARYLRGLAHHLNPVVQIGSARVTDPVIEKVDAELDNHELIKVRVQSAERHELDEAAKKLCESTRADLVQTIGHVLVLYRRRKEKPAIVLPRDSA